MKITRRITAVLLLCTFIACNQSDTAEQTTTEIAAVQQIADEEKTPTKQEQVPQDQPPAAGTPAPITWDKKIIKNAHLVIEVKDHKKFNAQVQAAVQEAGGYIAQAEQNKNDYKIEHILTIKVPVAQFDVAVNRLTNAQENIITQKITSQDVTGEVVDTKARLEAKRQVRQRYLDLLKQAKNMEEILQVQKEINELQVDMEAAAGRVNYLTHQASMSTIELTFYQVLNANANYPLQPSFAQRVLNSLSAGLEWLGEMLLILLTLWPVWMGLAGVWWGYRKFKKRAVKPA